MTYEEWKHKSDEWKDGYVAYIKASSSEELYEKSKEWCLGFDYAIRHAKDDYLEGNFPFIAFSNKNKGGITDER